MFSREEAKELTTLFWTSFGKYMGKQKPLYGNQIKWVNYRTGVKDIYFRLKFENKQPQVSIEIQHKDEDIRELFFEQFKQLKTVFSSIAGEWIWEEYFYLSQDQSAARIYIQLDKKTNIYIKDTWGPCFHFFEKNMVNLDEFWSEFNEIFKNLSD